MNQEDFKVLLRDKGLKVTSQRLLVLQVMAEHPGEHLTTEQIYDMVKQTNPEVGLATIYRTVQVMVELNLIDKINFDEDVARYELRNQNTKHHHHHAICLGCSKVISFEDDLLENLETAVDERIGFKVTDHEVKLYGYCHECRKQMEQQ